MKNSFDRPGCVLSYGLKRSRIQADFSQGINPENQAKKTTLKKHFILPRCVGRIRREQQHFVVVHDVVVVEVVAVVEKQGVVRLG